MSLYIANVRQYLQDSTPISLISKAFGVSHYGSRLRNEINIAYTAAICVVYSICFYFAYNTSPQNDYPAICLYGQLIHNYLGISICALGFYLTLRLSGKDYTNYMATNLQRIDQTMFAIAQVKVNHSRRNRQFQLKGVLIGCAAFVVIIVCDAIIFSSVYSSTATLTCIVYTYPFLLGTVIQGKFIAAVHQIYLRFKYINKLFTHISNVNDNNSKVVQVFSKIESAHKIGQRVATNKVSNVPPLFKLSPPKAPSHLNLDQQIPTNLHMHMHKLFEQHDNLLEISEWLNDLYSLQIVTFVSVAFVVILFGFFFETKVIFWLWGQNTRLILIAVSYFLWSCLMLAVIYTLLSVCTYTRDEAYNSAMIVHQILQRKPMFILNDEIYYNKLKAFTLKILHRKNSFQFNGMGLFTLDFTFIFSAVSAATSYLIVLLQFDLSADLEK